jgi:hypothetical protein
MSVPLQNVVSVLPVLLSFFAIRHFIVSGKAELKKQK